MHSVFIDEDVSNLPCFGPSQVQVCAICFESKLKQDIFDQHDICISCFKSFLKVKIESGQVQDIKCPHCQFQLTDQIIEQYTKKKIYDKYLRFKNNLIIAQNPLAAWCPNQWCNQVINLQNTVICQHCMTKICKECKQKHHEGVNCQENIQNQLQEWQVNRDIQQCPKCKFLVEKANGCNHMTCQYCLHEWCWICGCPYTPIHFAIFNPFGCPALMPGWVRQKEWGLIKLLFWRIFCCIMLLLLTPLLLIVVGPIFCVSKIVNTQIFNRSFALLKILLIINALILGILITPLIIALFVIFKLQVLIPSLIYLIIFYYNERQRLQSRHEQMMLRRNEELNV
ncbi:hypothetical protein pb186bvf_019680 [Paramecium bursaria]